MSVEKSWDDRMNEKYEMMRDDPDAFLDMLNKKNENKSLLKSWFQRFFLMKK